MLYALTLNKGGDSWLRFHGSLILSGLISSLILLLINNLYS